MVIDLSLFEITLKFMSIARHLTSLKEQRLKWSHIYLTHLLFNSCEKMIESIKTKLRTKMTSKPLSMQLVKNVINEVSVTKMEGYLLSSLKESLHKMNSFMSVFLQLNSEIVLILIEILIINFFINYSTKVNKLNIKVDI